MPTSPSSRPSTVIATPLSGEPRASVEPASSPSSISEQISAGPNLKRELHQHRREEDHLGDAERRADERRDHGDAERRAALALPRQRIAVEAGDGVRRMAGQVEQDRADRAAVLRAVVDARQHQDRGDRLHREGQRQQERDRRHHAHAGQHADDVAEQHADEAPQQVLRPCSATPKPCPRSVSAVPIMQKGHGSTGNCTAAARRTARLRRP